MRVLQSFQKRGHCLVEALAMTIIVYGNVPRIQQFVNSKLYRASIFYQFMKLSSLKPEFEEKSSETCLGQKLNVEKVFSNRNINEVTVILHLLKSCSKKKDLIEGSRIHTDVLNRGLLHTNPYIGSALISMYSKCGAIRKAEQVLHDLPIGVRDVASWNSLISGYVRLGQLKDAMNCFERMQEDFISPNAITFVCLLKGCANTGALDSGKQIHYMIARNGFLRNDILLGTALVDMYARCGALSKAEQVLDELAVRDVITWTTLITAYAKNGKGQEALNCFDRMQTEGISPDAVTFISLLKACASIGALDKGEHIHDHIAKSTLLESDVVLGTALVDMYAKCGALTKAKQVLSEVTIPDIAAWNTLLSGYVQHGLANEGLRNFSQMQNEGLVPNAITFICMSRACGFIKSINKSKHIHSKVLSEGYLERNIFLGNALVDMYAECGELVEAEQVFNSLLVRDVGTWNTLLTGFVKYDQAEKILKRFSEMKSQGISPNAVTYTCVLKACGSMGDINKGRDIHDDIVEKGMLRSDAVLGTALLDMYVKCGMLLKAKQVLRELPVQDVVSWTTMVSAYAQHGHGEAALSCFKQMKNEGFSPNLITYVSALKACGITGDINKGEEIYDEIVRMDLLKSSIVICNAVLDMYTKCGNIVQAEKLFNELPLRDEVSWTCLIAGYAQNGHGEEALNYFERMHREELSPNVVTFICALNACGNIGAIHKGKQIHDTIIQKDLTGKDIVLDNALVDMYAKCGALDKAEEILCKLPKRDLFSWNSLIAGYAQNGQGLKVILCFKCMQSDGISPNSITFVCILNACSHAGLLDEGEMYFMDMINSYKIMPDLDHYACMVDLYGRAGRLDKATQVIKYMHCTDHLPVWNALLGACQKWGNICLGILAFEKIVQFDLLNTSAYVLMTNIYAAAEMKDDAAKVEALKLKSQV